MDSVYKELESYGIMPNYMTSDKDDSEIKISDNELIENIKRRAYEVRLNWHGEGNADSEESCVKVAAIIENNNNKHEEVCDGYLKPISSAKFNEEKKEKGIGFENTYHGKKTKDDSKQANKDIVAKPIYVCRSINTESIDAGKTKTRNEEIKSNNDLQKPRFDFRRK